MFTKSWVIYFVSLALFFGNTLASPVKVYEIEEPDTTPSNPLLPRAGCVPCGASQAEIIFPIQVKPSRKWKRVCFSLCKAGAVLQLDAKTKKYECTASNCKRAGPGGPCVPKKCNPKTEDSFKGECLPKCKPPMVRNPTTGKCAATTAAGPKKAGCSATQELFKGKCLTKCKPPMVRNQTTGKCAATKATGPKTGPKKAGCSATQELFKGKCVAKCKAPKRRNAAGVCK